MKQKYIILFLLSCICLLFSFIIFLQFFCLKTNESSSEVVEIPNTSMPLSSNSSFSNCPDCGCEKTCSCVQQSSDEVESYSTYEENTINSTLLFNSYVGKENEIVSTLGYYDAYDGGAASYIIRKKQQVADNRTTFDLANDLQAELLVENNTIYIDQIGAHGDSISDDSSVINWALNCSDATIVFSNKMYKCLNTIIISANNIIVKGNGATLFSDNNFIGNEEWFIKVEGQNITLEDLNVLARETDLTNYKTQMGIVKASNVSLVNCSFSIPQTVYQSPTKAYTNLDLYSGWKDIIVKKCSFENYASTYGGNIWIRDIWNLGCCNADIELNELRKNTHDESIAVFNGSIKDVFILENNIEAIETNISDPSNLCFKFGSEKSNQCENIRFERNKVICSSTNFIAKIGNCNNLSIKENDITYTKIGSKALWLFDVSGSSTPQNVYISDNVITINSSVDISRVFNIPGYFSNNVLYVTDISIKNVFGKSESIDGGQNVLIKSGKQIQLK